MAFLGDVFELVVVTLAMTTSYLAVTILMGV